MVKKCKNIYSKRAQVLCGTFAQKIINKILGSIVVSIPACHAGDRASIPFLSKSNFSVFKEFPFFLFLDRLGKYNSIVHNLYEVKESQNKQKHKHKDNKTSN